MLSNEIDPEIRDVLTQREEVILNACENRMKPGGSKFSPNTLYITNMRIIFKNPKLFGFKCDVVDFNYQDISNVRIKRGLFSSEIFLKARHRSDEVSLPAIDKDIAQQVCSLIQQGIKGDLPRQILGGSNTSSNNSPSISVNVVSAPQSGAAIVSEKTNSIIESKISGEVDILNKLVKLKELRDSGILTEMEFNKLKSSILGNQEESHSISTSISVTKENTHITSNNSNISADSNPTSYGALGGMGIFRKQVN